MIPVMKMEKTLIVSQSYGRVSLRLREIMDTRGINRNELARSVNVRFEVIDRWYRGDVEKLDLDILARICCVLDCTPEVLLQYEAPVG